MQNDKVTPLTDLPLSRRVLVIGLGGTIQMEIVQIDGKTCNAPPENTDRFRSVLKARLEEVSGLVYDFLLISTEDSIDKGPKDWMLVAAQVWEAQRAGYDAVIITHGTDTIAYTAQALWLSFFDRTEDASALRIPVVITGGQNSVYLPGGDGVFNIHNAARTVHMAIDQGIADVLVVMWDKIHRGIWVQKETEKAFPVVGSPGRPLAGTIDGHGIHFNIDIAHKRDRSIVVGSLPSAKFDTSFSFSINLLPGTNPTFLERLITGEYSMKLVMLVTEGEGNIAKELLPFIQETSAKNVGAIITSHYAGADIKGASYLAGMKATEAGAGHSGRLNYIGVWVLMAWLIAWYPDANRQELLRLFSKFARAL